MEEDAVSSITSDAFVHTSINDLMNCLSTLTVKDPPVNAKEELERYATKINIERRNSSTIIAMRKFHNWIKKNLIVNLTNELKQKNIFLLDIAVGRGGDIDKWKTARISGVFGFDTSEESINSMDPFNQGAKERLKNFQDLNVNVQFEVGDALNPSEPLIKNINSFLKKHHTDAFQIVSCQFALHYFFKEITDLQIVLAFVSRYLKKGGFFIGTTMDGSKIKNLFKGMGNVKIYNKNPLFVIKRDFTMKQTSPYGNKYRYIINDINDAGNYFNTMGESTEYLVDFDELRRVAANFGLEPYNMDIFDIQYSGGKKSFPEYRQIVKDKKSTISKASNVISFDEIYEMNKWKPNPRPLSDHEIGTNDLYSTFVFRKI